jgi:hypothetical protein
MDYLNFTRIMPVRLYHPKERTIYVEWPKRHIPVFQYEFRRLLFRNEVASVFLSNSLRGKCTTNNAVKLFFKLTGSSKYKLISNFTILLNVNEKLCNCWIKKKSPILRWNILRKLISGSPYIYVCVFVCVGGGAFTNRTQLEESNTENTSRQS